jgi:phage terminase small subunit
MARVKRIRRKKRPGRIKGVPNKVTQSSKNKKYFKIRTFVDQYLVDLNATKAYQRCGFGGKNKTSTAIEASKKMNDPEVQQAIWEEMEKRRATIRISQERVISELASLAFANIKDICAWTGNVISAKDSDELETIQAAAIQEVAETKQGIRVKMHDKKSALIDLGKHLGLFWDADGKGKDADDEANKIRKALQQMEEKTNGGTKKT